MPELSISDRKRFKARRTSLLFEICDSMETRVKRVSNASESRTGNCLVGGYFVLGNCCIDVSLCVVIFMQRLISPPTITTHKKSQIKVYYFSQVNNFPRFGIHGTCCFGAKIIGFGFFCRLCLVITKRFFVRVNLSGNDKKSGYFLSCLDA